MQVVLAALVVARPRDSILNASASVDEAAEWGDELRFLHRAAVRAEVHSPLRQAGLLASPKRKVFLDPARLVRGLARGCDDRAVVLPERARIAWLVRR